MGRKCFGAAMALFQILFAQCSVSEPDAIVKKDIQETVVTHFTVTGRLRRCELFIYRCDALGTLAAHKAAENAVDDPQFFIGLEKGRYRAVAVCNACASINPAAVARREAFDIFSYSYADEDPSYPLCTSALEFEAGEQIRIASRKLLCTVHLVSVRREFRGGDAKTVVERLQAFLTNVPAKSEVLREHGFHPSEFVEQGTANSLLCQRLESDLGYGELHPHIKLYCYPNDSEEGDIASPHTRIVLEGRVNGKYCRWEAGLGVMERGCDKYVEFVLKNESECVCLIY